jgi:hypothetical protein
MERDEVDGVAVAGLVAILDGAMVLDVLGALA